MKKVAIFTTTRAEFGILSPLLEQIEKSDEITFLLFVGGAHLSEKYGSTIEEIHQAGFFISETFDYLNDGFDTIDMANGLSSAVKKVADIFKRFEFDFVCIVGDRYELLSIVATSLLFKKPIIHLHGGEESQGAIDEQIRHMITKAAHLHFAACEEYAKNICRMGEPTWRVHNTGALSIDNIVKMKKIPKKDLFNELGLEKNKPTTLVTYHPVTLEFNILLSQQIQNLFSALEQFDLQWVITAPNVDVERDKIVSFIEEKVRQNPNAVYINSLGVRKYHSLIPHCELVIGNSSSGILEVPFFRIPTVNIGDRQKGRIRHESAIDTDYSVDSIRKGIEKALSVRFRETIRDMPFKFGDGHAAEKMVEIIKKVKIDQDFLRKSLEFTN